MLDVPIEDGYAVIATSLFNGLLPYLCRMIADYVI